MTDLRPAPASDEEPTPGPTPDPSPVSSGREAHPHSGVLPTFAVRFWLAAAGLLSMALVVPAAPSDFLMSFWALSVQRGYRSRALPATVVQALGFERVTVRLVSWVSVLVLLAVLGLLVRLATAGSRWWPSWTTLLLGMLVVGSPASLRSFAFELVAFDGLVLLVTVTGLVVLLRDGGSWRLPAVGALAAVGVLVHEGFVLLALPLLLAAVVVRAGPAPLRRVAAEAAVVLVVPLLALAWVAAEPTLPRGDVAARSAVVRSVVELGPGEEKSRWAILNHTRTIADNVRYTADVVRKRGHGRHLISLLACVPTVAAAALVGRRLVPDGRPLLLTGLWAGSSVAPLLLALLGHDWGRWIAYGTLNAVLGVVWLAARQRTTGEIGRTGAARGVTHVVVGLTVLALMTPPFARDGSFRVRVGQPAEVLKVLLDR